VRLVLNTNAYSGLMRGQEAVVRPVRSAGRIYVPAPVVGELLFGFRGSARFQQNREQLQRFLRAAPVEFVPTDQTVCDRYGLILHQLRAKGQPIATNDIWVAAHTLALGADLLSGDQHFGAVDCLSWISP